MAAFGRLSLKYRLHLSNVLFLIILVVVILLYFSSDTTLNNLVRDQESFNRSAAQVRNTALKVKDYLAKEVPYDEMASEFTGLSSGLKGGNLAADITSLRQNLDKFNTLRTENEKIAAEIDKLTTESAGKSIGYIEAISKKLADEKKRSEVSTLERLVIIGANTNTTANYEIKVRFLKLKQNMANKDSLLGFLKTLTVNAERDIKNLSKTPFAGLPVAAKKANIRIRDLTLAFIGNVEKQKTIRKDIFSGIDKIMTGIETEGVRNNETLLNSIRTLFRSLVVVVLVVGLLGIILTTFLASTVSRALKRSIASLTHAANQVKSASAQVSETSQNLAEGNSEQAAGIEETSSSLAEMASMTRRNSDNAGQANNLMDEAKGVVEGAGETMEELSSSMEGIGKSGQEIGKIVNSIDEIAFQTNLLALNAAVEAARAGEAGAGFAVVADEVRSLAMRAAEAARSTQDLIEDTVNQIGRGTTLVDKTVDSFARQTELAMKMASLVREVADASGEQAKGVDQINTAVSQLDQVVQRNAASAEESAASSQELHSQAEALTGVVRELTGLVQGQGKTGDFQTVQAPPPSKPKESPVKGGPPAAKRVVPPEELIPFEDEDDFQDF